MPSSLAFFSLLPAFFARDDIRRLFRDGRGGLAAEAFDLLRRLLAREEAQRAGQHEVFPAKRVSVIRLVDRKFTPASRRRSMRSCDCGLAK